MEEPSGVYIQRQNSDFLGCRTFVCPANMTRHNLNVTGAEVLVQKIQDCCVTTKLDLFFILKVDVMKCAHLFSYNLSYMDNMYVMFIQKKNIHFRFS